MLAQPSSWVPKSPTFYPASLEKNDAGDAFSAPTELKKLQDQCYSAYPDGLIKGYHKGRAKAYNKCMDAASNTINTMIKENTKLTTELAFNSAVSGALGSSSVDSASTGDNTNLYIGMAVVAILMVGGYYFYSKKTTPAVAGAPAPAAAPAATV